MTKAFRLFLLLINGSYLFAAIDDKIESTQVSIDNKKSQEKRLSKQLEKIAKNIDRHIKNIKELDKDIRECQISIKNLKKKALSKSNELKKIEKVYKKLEKREKIVGDKVVNILSRELSIDIITNGDIGSDSQGLQKHDRSLDNIIMNEILHTYTDILKKEFKRSKSKYIKLNKSIDLVKAQLMTLSQKVDKLKLKRETLKKLKDTQKETIAALKRDKKRYIERLNKIKREQNSLSATLKKLNIIKKKREQKIIKSDSKIAVNVRKIGSSYQHGKLVKYRGPKTIAPLRTYTISQNFGNFIDPIYHIKVFNDSVVLKAKRKNAKVYNILDGKVIYAQKTPMLDRVVIIKNRDNIHTIYAHLSKIAPTVKVGRYLKKGYVIGRVDRELNFEVTKDGMNINPMRLIK